jgi:hypothetical protein
MDEDPSRKLLLFVSLCLLLNAIVSFLILLYFKMEMLAVKKLVDF